MARIEIINGRYVYANGDARRSKDFDQWLERMSMMDMLVGMERRILPHTDHTKPFVWRQSDGTIYDYDADMDDGMGAYMGNEYQILKELMGTT